MVRESHEYKRGMCKQKDVEYKTFKNKKVKVYYTHSDMMKSIGIMMPVFNLGKKMHMNH